MKHQQTIELIKRLITQIESDGIECGEEQLIEPSSAFTERERFDKEKQLFFYDTPQVVGFSSELTAKGSFVEKEVLGIPIVITRDENDTLRAFINACAHRGARVAQGSGEKRKLVCQFHGWAYNLDGSLSGRPQNECFEKAGPECNLQELAVADCEGLLVVAAHQAITQQQVDKALAGIRDQLEDFDLRNTFPLETRRIKVQANWKLIADLSHESYHFKRLHRDSVAQFLEDNAVYDTFDRHSRWAFALKGLEKLKEKPEEQWPRFLPGAMNHTLFPGTVMIKNEHDAQMIRVEPGSHPGESIIYFSGVYKDKNNREAALGAFEFGYQVFKDEDLPAAEQCQQGYQAGMPTMIAGKNEPVIVFWHTLWNQLLEQAE